MKCSCGADMVYVGNYEGVETWECYYCGDAISVDLIEACSWEHKGVDDED